MKVIDISRDLLKTPVYPGDPEGYLDEVESFRAGGHCNLNAVYTCLHTGTHVDAPLHFVEGDKDVSVLAPERFIGECTVVEAPPGPITGEYAEEHFPWAGCERLLIKGNGLSYLMESSAYTVADNGIRLVGTDSASIGIHGTNSAVHRALLLSDVLILEGLDLSGVKPGKYFLMAQPLKISGAEGAPCRAVLVEDYLFWSGTRT